MKNDMNYDCKPSIRNDITHRWLKIVKYRK